MVKLLLSKRVLLFMVLDSLIIACSLLLACLIRFGETRQFADYLIRLWWLIPLGIVVRITVFKWIGLYQWSASYFSLQDIKSLLQAVGLSFLIMVVFLFVFRESNTPFSILIIDAIICFLGVGGSRAAIRIWKESRGRAINEKSKKNILLVGAGDAGEMIARDILKSPRFGFNLIGFIDDSEGKKGKSIHALPVLGTVPELPKIVSQYFIDEVIIAIPSAKAKEIRRIVDYCEKSGVPFRLVPGLLDLLGGTVNIDHVREVQIEDLLGREPVNTDIREIASYLNGVPVLVTGAGGSIGAEICRQIALYLPSELILVGRGENSIFEIEYELKKRHPYLNCRTIIGNICDKWKMEHLFNKHRPQVIFHTAAHKHVSLMENNPEEAVMNNIIGTKILVDLADKYKAQYFINISTDKAVNPVSIMGVSKRIAERLVQAKGTNGTQTRFVSVRFGNVLGSRGSVVPLFKKQIAAGGPVTVTHPEVRRYFMTIPEAVQLVIQAGAMGQGGEVFVLDMGEPVKIIDLAKDLIKLSGLEVGQDIAIEFTGLRPGEKLFEEFLTPTEAPAVTKHKKIFIAQPDKIDHQQLEHAVNELVELAKIMDIKGIKKKIKEIIPAYDFH